MGKLTVNEAEKLHTKGVITTAALQTMREEGLASSRTTATKRWMKSANGKNVTPQLYFSGIGKDGEYSKKMIEFKNEFNTLREKYTTTTTNKTTKK
jgi:hypothetical protein|tara:strand:- start:151 stop:438 length:288 start_codon:yes stop_codon:yes gene_type:complete